MRRSRDERRDHYLDIGAEIVAESAPSPGTDSEPGDVGLALAHVKLADVAERAGVTKGALYHLWPSQEAYWRDLLDHLLRTNRLVGADHLATIAVDLAQVGGDEPTLRDYANALFDSLREDPAFFARISLFAYLDDERVRTQLDEDFRVATDRVLPVLAEWIRALGRRPKHDTSLRDLVVETASLLEGLCLQYRLGADRTPDVPLSGGRRWTLFAAAAEALLFAHTEPGDDGVTDDSATTGRHLIATRSPD